MSNPLTALSARWREEADYRGGAPSCGACKTECADDLDRLIAAQPSEDAAYVVARGIVADPTHSYYIMGLNRDNTVAVACVTCRHVYPGHTPDCNAEPMMAIPIRVAEDWKAKLAAQPSGWQPIASTKLNERCLALDNSGIRRIASPVWVNGERSWVCDSGWHFQPTHVMPLPASPERAGTHHDE